MQFQLKQIFQAIFLPTIIKEHAEAYFCWISVCMHVIDFSVGHKLDLLYFTYVNLVGRDFQIYQNI